MSTRINGTQYYYDFRSPNTVSPAQSSGAPLRFFGHFIKDWTPESIEFDNFGYGAKRTSESAGRIYCDLSETVNPHGHNINQFLPNITEGYISLTLSFPFDINNGTPSITYESFLLWAITMYGNTISFPSCSSYIDQNGLNFRLWNVVDHVITYNLNYSRGDRIRLEYLWGTNPIQEYNNANVLLRINGDDVAVSFVPLLPDEENKDIIFCALDYPVGGSPLECTIHELIMGRYSGATPTMAEEWHSTSSSSSSSIDSSSSSSSSSFGLTSSSSSSSSSSSTSSSSSSV